MKHHKFTIGHMYCGIGGNALGAAAAEARWKNHAASFETVGGIDFDELACVDFQDLAQAPALCADMHEVTPAMLRKAWGRRAPDFVMSSPPCKGYSGLLSAEKAKDPKYERMNELLERSLFLLCSTWKEPPAVIFFENVPRIASRGKAMIARCVQMLQAHGYSVHAGNHDCGEVGGLAQHRRRWFMVARHRDRVPQAVYHPPKHRVRGCGEVLGTLPIPGDVVRGGPMHSVPGISWRNWVRLALIPAGGDWRDLPNVVPEGKARREVFRRDPVGKWEEPALTVIGASRPGSGAPSVADPRFTEGKKKNWQQVAGVTPWSEPIMAITSNAGIHAGAFQVADPRAAAADVAFTCEMRAGTYRVIRWEDAAATIVGSASIDNGAAAVADPRINPDVADLMTLNPDKAPPFTPVIIAPDGTWHRPLTTLELAALQGFPTEVDGKPLQLAGDGHTRWREAIGNAVPPPAAMAVAGQFLRSLLIAKVGGAAVDQTPYWV